MASAVTGMAVVVLMGCLSLPRFFSTVSAQEYDAAEAGTAETVSASGQDGAARDTEQTTAVNMDAPYGPYESMTREEWEAYVAQQQARQETQQIRRYVAYNSDPGALTADDPESKITALTVSVDDLARMEAKQSRTVEAESQTWHNPLVLETYVSSPFGYRWHPVYQYYRMHNGVDLDSDYGDEVRSTRDGTVVETGWNQYYGYYVMVDHGDGFVSEYFHLSRYFVDEGQEVRACEIIGLVGSTGVSTGPHLHFGLLFEGEYVDPENYVDFD